MPGCHICYGVVITSKSYDILQTFDLDFWPWNRWQQTGHSPSDKQVRDVDTDKLPNLCRQYFWHTHLIRYSLLYRMCDWIR